MEQAAVSYLPKTRTGEVQDLTIGDLLREASRDSGQQPALVDGARTDGESRTWTYSELLACATTVAQGLLTRFSKGDRVAIWAPNSPEWVLFQLGAGMAGITMVTINPAYQESEVAYVLRKSGAVAIFAASEYRGHQLLKTLAHLRDTNPDLGDLIVVRMEDWDTFVASADTTIPLPEVRPDDTAQVQFTSGTTGFPKGVVLHHRGTINASRLATRAAGMRPGFVWINVMPLFHVGGCVSVGLGTLGNRGTHVVLPEFDAGMILDAFERFHGNIALLVPTMLVRLLAHPDLQTRDLSSVKVIVSGASPVPAEIIQRTKLQLNCEFSNIYGQTEVSCVCTSTGPHDTPEDQSETIGRPIPHVEIKIEDPLTGQIPPRGVEGEICVRGYQLMGGYLDDPEANAATISDDGWLHSGDLGSMDERGYLKITGRLTDMIIRGGENISPREIEDLLYQAPGVAEAVVIGIPDPEWGERVAAFIRPNDPERAPSADELRAFVRSRLAKFKTPDEWHFVDEFPLTPSGKIQKYVVKATHLARRSTV